MIDFPLMLLLATVFTGVVALYDVIYCRGKKEQHKPVVIDYSRALFPVLLIVLLIRSFIVQPYRVPSGSLEPTVIPGDFILVNQYDYGLHLPVWHTKILPIGEPKRGQIVLFRWPVNPHVTFVKRVIGLPGDKISYINKVLYINGKEAKQKDLGFATDTDGPGTPTWRVQKVQENLLGVKHDIYICPASSTECPGHTTHNFHNLVVPKGYYFMMGDNRDNSDDSRDWGFVPQGNLIGRAMFVFLSWDSSASLAHKIRWGRIGTKL